MILNELLVGQQVIVSFEFNEEIIEFYSNVVEQSRDGIYITPYLHKDVPLELNIDMDDNVICNIFADNSSNGERVGWKNVCLSTVKKGSKILYYVKTSKFKEFSNYVDRRRNERMPVKKSAQLYDSNNGTYTTIVINDVSETGISFYTNSRFSPSSNHLDIIFEDNINEKTFKLNINCSVERTQQLDENTLYGCSIRGENNNYRLYVLFKKLSYKQYKMAM